MTLRLSASVVPNNDAVPHSPLRPIGLPLVRHSRVYIWIVNQTPVSNHQITVAPVRLWTLIDQVLQGRLIPSPAHPETNNANAGWLNPSDYVPSVFRPTKVCNSSISTRCKGLSSRRIWLVRVCSGGRQACTCTSDYRRQCDQL